MRLTRIDSDYLRSVIFGVEDGLVSSTGAVIGIAAGSNQSKIVILAGLVIVVVEAISMAAGQFITEEAVHDLEAGRHHDSLIGGAVLMFFSYLLAGLIPILPFFFLDLGPAMLTAGVLALSSLFGFGYLKGKVTKVSKLRSAFKNFVIGGIATSIGLIVGLVFKV